MLKHKRHEIPEDRSINMTPMIDVVFQLILFFMLTSSLARPNQIELNLPESSSGAPARDRPHLVVTYRLEGGQPAITLNEQAIEGLPQLAAALKAGADPAENPQVDVRIEKTVPYQDVISVLDTVRNAGFPKFSLLTLSASAPKEK